MTIGFNVTQDARDVVLRLLSQQTDARDGREVDWHLLADTILREAVPLVEILEVNERQQELDAEYLTTQRAQQLAAEVQVEQARRVADMVERSEELIDLQTDVARQQLAGIGTGLNDYTLWRDALMIVATICPPDASFAEVELEARKYRESLRWAGYPPDILPESVDPEQEQTQND